MGLLYEHTSPSALQEDIKNRVTEEGLEEQEKVNSHCTRAVKYA